MSMRPRGGMFFAPRGNSRFGSGIALNSTRTKTIRNMNSGMRMGMVPRGMQQMAPKMAPGMIPRLVPTMVPRMVPRSVPRIASGRGPIMRSNIKHRAGPCALICFVLAFLIDFHC